MKKVIYTAIFGPYEELKEPIVITPGWEYVCFTDQPLISENWKIQQTEIGFNDILSSRLVKIQFNHFVEADLSIWIDGSFTINCNLDEWIVNHFPIKKEMLCIKHPIRDCIYEEGEVCTRYGKDNGEIARQLQDYSYTVPKRNGLIQSGILVRRHTPRVIKLCEEWYWEVMNYSNRDQIAFGKVSLRAKFMEYMKWDYRSGKEFIYKTHFKNRR